MKKYILYLLLAFSQIAFSQIVQPEKGTLQFVRNSEVRSSGATLDSINKDFILCSTYLDTTTFIRKHLMTNENGVKDFVAETKTHYTIIDVPSLPLVSSVYGELQVFDCNSITNINNNNLLLKNGSTEGYIILPSNPNFDEIKLYYDSTSTANLLYFVAPTGDRIRTWNPITGAENVGVVEIAQEKTYSIYFKRIGNTWYYEKQEQGAYIASENIIGVNINKLFAPSAIPNAPLLATAGGVVAANYSLPTILVKNSNQTIFNSALTGNIITELGVNYSANKRYKIKGSLLVSNATGGKLQIAPSDGQGNSNYTLFTMSASNKYFSQLESWMYNEINQYKTTFETNVYPVLVQFEVIIHTTNSGVFFPKILDDGSATVVWAGSFIEIEEY
jgi:hypothetical protein